MRRTSLSTVKFLRSGNVSANGTLVLSPVGARHGKLTLGHLYPSSFSSLAILAATSSMRPRISTWSAVACRSWVSPSRRLGIMSTCVGATGLMSLRGSAHACARRSCDGFRVNHRVNQSTFHRNHSFKTFKKVPALSPTLGVGRNA